MRSENENNGEDPLKSKNQLVEYVFNPVEDFDAVMDEVMELILK